MKDKLILFGAGFYGRDAYFRFKDEKEIVCMVDNHPENVDHTQFEVPVVGCGALSDHMASDVDVIICTRYYPSIAAQLSQSGIESFYVLLEGFLYHFDQDETMMPVELADLPYYKRENSNKTILFVQNAACIRTHKEALLMKDAGFNVCLLYTLVPPVNEYSEYYDIYDHVWGFTSADGIRDFIENSDFDLVHCSNEPDILITIAQETSKPVVFDTHDMQSIRGKMDINGLVLEYIANTCSDGNIYPSEGLKRIAEKKYDLTDKKILVLENLVLDQVEISERKEKLSRKDGEVHCVYEGGITGDNKENHRYFQDIWMRMAGNGVHIHFYSSQDPAYCKYLEQLSPYLHFEGNVGGTDLIKEMTQYDVGLLMFNVTDQSRLHLEIASPNKTYEYLNAGLPLIVDDIQCHIDFIEEYHAGIRLDLDGNIKEQLLEAKKIMICEDFLRENQLTLRSKQERLASFYEEVMKRHAGREVTGRGSI